MMMMMMMMMMFYYDDNYNNDSDADHYEDRDVFIFTNHDVY